MKTKISFLLLVNLLIGCTSDDDHTSVNQANEILMLRVDYTTNEFEGGKVFDFPEHSEDFTIANEYDPPGDFGSLKLTYEEIDETLFFGTIVWSGLGEMTFPQNLQPANGFEFVLTEDFVVPVNGFENILDPYQQWEYSDYEKAWASIQGLVKIREYLSSNPNQKVKLFLYTPSVGVGNPADWDWIVYLKK